MSVQSTTSTNVARLDEIHIPAGLRPDDLTTSRFTEMKPGSLPPLRFTEEQPEPPSRCPEINWRKVGTVALAIIPAAIGLAAVVAGVHEEIADAKLSEESKIPPVAIPPELSAIEESSASAAASASAVTGPTLKDRHLSDRERMIYMERMMREHHHVDPRFVREHVIQSLDSGVPTISLGASGAEMVLASHHHHAVADESTLRQLSEKCQTDYAKELSKSQAKMIQGEAWESGEHFRDAMKARMMQQRLDWEANKAMIEQAQRQIERSRSFR